MDDGISYGRNDPEAEEENLIMAVGLNRHDLVALTGFAYLYSQVYAMAQVLQLSAVARAEQRKFLNMEKPGSSLRQKIVNSWHGNCCGLSRIRKNGKKLRVKDKTGL
jgi:hypothetical protein